MAVAEQGSQQRVHEVLLPYYPLVHAFADKVDIVAVGSYGFVQLSYVYHFIHWS